MSADNFAKMMLGTVASNNTSASAASAFEQKMRDAAASYNAMRQVEAELKPYGARPHPGKLNLFTVCKRKPTAPSTGCVDTQWR